MKRALEFLKSPTGNLTLVLVFAAVTGGFIYVGSRRAKREAEQLTRVEALTPKEIKDTILRGGKPLILPPPLERGAPLSPGASQWTKESSAARGARTRVASEKPAPSPVLPISLFSGEAPSGSLSKNYAPYGRLIPCETVVTLESSRLDTPVIGLVTEDIWHDGQLIIPAGTEVHGRAGLDPARERISATGKWVVVWRDASPLNGSELVLNGIALNRERDDLKNEFGLHDGSAGLRGDLIKSDDWQEIKLFASTFLAGVSGGLQQMRSESNVLGEIAQVPLTSGKNAALQGTATVLNSYARQIQEAIARDGFFVRVPAGKQFYLYVTETIDQSKGARGNARNEEVWRKDNETSHDIPAGSAPRRM